MKFEDCPKCHGKWESASIKFDKIAIPYWRCATCNIHYYDNREQVSLRNYLRPNYNLVWYCEENCCRYGSLEEAVVDGTLKLPWLPFTISKERLQLLLLFS